jgi:hypothetical protein
VRREKEMNNLLYNHKHFLMIFFFFLWFFFSFFFYSPQVFRIGAFTSEKQLTNCVRNFFTDPTAEVFVLQVDTQADAPHVLLAKSILDQLRIEFFEQMGGAYA